MNTLDASMRQHFHQQLARREAELRLLLRNSGDLGSEAPDTAPRDVVDFKELATEQTQATGDDAKTKHAVHELDQLAAARRRLDVRRLQRAALHADQRGGRSILGGGGRGRGAGGCGSWATRRARAAGVRGGAGVRWAGRC